MRRLAIIGLALTVGGLVLAVGFWPLTSVSGAELLAAKSGNQYTGYAPGARITIHEKVLDLTYTNFLGGVTTLDLDDGNPDVSTVIYVRGNATAVVHPGDVMFASAVLQVVTILGSSFHYWEVATPGDVHMSWPVDAVFYGIMGTGVVILAIAAFRKP